MGKFLYLLDSGHGGMINGVYQTAPKKMFTFPGGEVAYEGVFNRIFKNSLFVCLKKKGIRYADISPGEQDIPLSVRVETAKKLCDEHGSNNCVLLSLHSNAGGGAGFEIFTTKGKTKSDEYAEMLAKILTKKFPYIKFRADMTDSDLDKEEDFYILRNVPCPAILSECLFFDNWSDYQLLKDQFFQINYVQALVEFIETVENGSFNI